MNLAIIGSRSFNDYDLLQRTIDSLLLSIDEGKSIKKIDLIISGHAFGADRLGEKYATENEIPIKLFLPDWKKHGRSAGVIRNIKIVDEADLVLAFWDGYSKGTKISIDFAHKTNKKLIVIKFRTNRKN